MRRQWPWYSFVYKLAGAQGSFWLWILALLGMWLFFDGMLIRLLNQAPHARSVADVAGGRDLRKRWVSVDGVELVDAGQLFGEAGASGSPLRLLIDATDPAAQRWRTLARLAESLGDRPEPGSELGRRFGKMRARFAKERGSYIPWRSLRLYESGGVAPVVSRCSLAKPLVQSDGDPLSAYRREFTAAVELVRAKVKPNIQLTGLLDRSPPSILSRAKAELGLPLAEQTLRVGRGPKEHPLVIFWSCAGLLLFLAAGLHGVLRSGAVAASEPPLPDAPSPLAAPAPSPSGPQDS